jgi:hypothetical protein
MGPGCARVQPGPVAAAGRSREGEVFHSSRSSAYRLGANRWEIDIRHSGVPAMPRAQASMQLVYNCPRSLLPSCEITTQGRSIRSNSGRVSTTLLLLRVPVFHVLECSRTHHFRIRSRANVLILRGCLVHMCATRLACIHREMCRVRVGSLHCQGNFKRTSWKCCSIVCTWGFSSQSTRLFSVAGTLTARMIRQWVGPLLPNST